MMIATLLTLALGSPVQAQPARPVRLSAAPTLKGENAPIERDLVLACALTRMAAAASNSPAYQSQKDELYSRTREMAKVGLRSKKAQDALTKALAAKDIAAKQAVWVDLATSISLDKWHCPSIGDL